MGKYDAQASMALRMISSKGAKVTFSRGGALIDPVLQTRSAATTYDARAVAFAMSARDARKQFGEAVDINVARLSVYVAMKGVAQTPRGGDKFTWGGRAFKFSIDPEILDPAGDGPILATGYAEAA